MKSLYLICLGYLIGEVFSFSVSPRSLATDSFVLLRQPLSTSASASVRYLHGRPPSLLCESDTPDDGEISQPQDTFDGQGFADYLAPYVLTAIASIVVTGLFVKFVLMDY